MRILTLILSLVCLSAFAEEDIRQKIAEYNLKDTTRLAQQGDADAQLKLGLMYAYGKSVKVTGPVIKGKTTYKIVDIIKKDSVEASKWYLKSAQQGNSIAQIRIAYFYLTGEAVKEDLIEAYAYYILAGLTTQDPDQKQKEFESILTSSQIEAAQKRKYLESVLSPSQIEAGQKRSMELQTLVESNKKANSK
jgi:TPR repeat protein